MVDVTLFPQPATSSTTGRSRRRKRRLPGNHERRQAVNAHFAVVPPTCYALTLTHAGQGSNPVASPANSAGLRCGQYVAGEAISLSGAAPRAAGRSAAGRARATMPARPPANSLTMPASAHTAGVTYTETTVPPAQLSADLDPHRSGQRPSRRPG